MAQERWQVTGSAAVQYERYAVEGFFAAWADDLLTRAELQPGERVLDVACGTGIVSRGAITQVGETGSVTGVDLNAGMLAEAVDHVPAGRQIHWREGDATALPFDDASFDVILCQQGLQFFPDKSAAAAEMRRVLAPGGRVLVSVWRSLDHNPYSATVAEALGRHLDPKFEAMMTAPFAFGDAADLEAVFRLAGFDDIGVETVELKPQHARSAQRVEGLLLGLPMAESVAAMQPAAREAMIGDVLAGIPGDAAAPAVMSPQSTHVLTARRAGIER